MRSASEVPIKQHLNHVASCCICIFFCGKFEDTAQLLKELGRLNLQQLACVLLNKNYTGTVWDYAKDSSKQTIQLYML